MKGSDNRISKIVRQFVPARLSRYDLLLAIIPLAFLLALLAGFALSIPPQLSLVAASVIGAVALVDGLFRNPPTAGSDGRPGS